MPAEDPYWSRHMSALLAELGTGDGGLTPQDAATRLAGLGDNGVAESARRRWLRLLLRQFESPLVLVLVVAASVSLALREWIDAALVLAIVLGSALIGFVQEHRAAHAVAALERRLALRARVLRDGAETLVPAEHVVPGDIVLLAAGNLIPADGVVLAAQDFLVSEAAMTGESFPVEKRPGTVAVGTPVSRRENCVFLGASVRSGTARVLAVRTGRRTEYGAIAASLAAVQPETAFMRGIRDFGAMLVRIMTVVVLFVLTANLLLGRPPIDSLLFAVALAVGLSPELLPAIVAVTLAAGARAMSRRGVIVRRLEAIEDLGSIDVLCTDKTGTLTEGKVALHAALDAAGMASAEVVRLAFLNAALETGIENPLDAALVAAGEAAGLTAAGIVKIDEIPYDFQRRRLTIVIAVPGNEDTHLIVTKGALANVLDACVAVELGGAEAPLDARRRAALEAIGAARGEAGLRVLALASRRVPARAHYGRDDETAMVFRGFLVFADPPRADAARAIADLAALGIRVKMITGDNRHVAAHLARAVGLDPAAIMTGAELMALKDEALWHRAPRTDLFAEIDPQAKARIVRALQHAGHAVGYMGDGINDAPALQCADVGISVEGAVDVARECADIVLVERGLDVLRAGIEEGRRSFANTMTYVSITTSASFGNMVSMAMATPLLPFLPMAAKQVLLNNLLSDLPMMALSRDRVDVARIASPRRWSIAAIRRFMLGFGLLSSVFDLAAFAVLLLMFRAGEAEFQTAWFTISLLTELAIILVLRTDGPVFASRPSPMLAALLSLVATAALAIPFVRPVATAFGFAPLPPALLAGAAALIVLYVLANEALKARLAAGRAAQ
jgi:Mg2+-importing ATPase